MPDSLTLNEEVGNAQAAVPGCDCKRVAIIDGGDLAASHSGHETWRVT